jgi:threonylcarbamoyladenosine tRNA methylthiotransferase MtaB
MTDHRHAPRVAIATLGCKVNAYHTATIADRLRAAGCVLVEPDAPADVVIVNSCTVTDAADAESRRLARRARRTNPAARVILTGCFAQTQPTAAAPRVARIEVGNSRRATTVETFGARTFDGQTRAFLKVQEGCDLFCTFCIVPMARGRSRSLPPRAILAELEDLAARGFQEIVLTGVHPWADGDTDLEPFESAMSCLPVEPVPLAVGFPGSLGVFVLFHSTDEVEGASGLLRFVRSEAAGARGRGRPVAAAAAAGGRLPAVA